MLKLVHLPIQFKSQYIGMQIAPVAWFILFFFMIDTVTQNRGANALHCHSELMGLSGIRSEQIKSKSLAQGITNKTGYRRVHIPSS